MSEDLVFMRAALALGWRQQGLTSPNPSVGAIIVQNSDAGFTMVGRGATQTGGRPHGEPMALAMAGKAAEGATLYVTLEPCAHHGRAEPCADAVIRAGIRRVVSAIEDPDIRVAGQGHVRLRAAGVEVATGVLEQEALRAHRGHILRVTQGRPMVMLKMAQTKDGFASYNGSKRLFITSDAANKQVHLMRMHADAILIGLGTVLADDPMLTVRLPGLSTRSPIRVILDSHLRTPLDKKVVTSATQYPTWIICSPTANTEKAKYLEDAGVSILRVELGEDGRISLCHAMQLLAQRGVARVMAEGGPQLSEAFARADLVDELITITGPSTLFQMQQHIVDGVPAIAPCFAHALKDPQKYRFVEKGNWGSDLFEKFERNF